MRADALLKRGRRKLAKSAWAEYYAAQNTKASCNHLLSWVFKTRVKNLLKHKPAWVPDLGCGRGADTCALLKEGFNVYACDAELQALQLLVRRLKNRKAYLNRLELYHKNFEQLCASDFLYPLKLVNANNSLFFCRAKFFAKLWNLIERALVPRGIMVCTFLGPRDSWAKSKHVHVCSVNKVRRLFSRFRLLKFVEKEFDGQTLTGIKKHWHLIQVVGRKL